MTLRRNRVRSTIAVLLVSLTALWAFAAYMTVQSGLRLWSVELLDQGVARPVSALVTALQEERAASTGPDDGGLLGARAATDQTVAELRRSTSGRLVRWAAPVPLGLALDALTGGLDQLTAVRRAVDSGGSAPDAYTGMIAAAFRVDDQLPQSSAAGTTLIGLARARELLAQEQAQTLPGSPQFALLVGARRAALTDRVSRLPAGLRGGFDQVLAGPAYSRLTSLETTGATAAVPADQWRAAVEPVLDQLGQAEQGARDTLRAQRGPQALIVIGELLLVIALGCVAVFAALNISIITARRLRTLRDAADDIATRRLPAVVERLGRGERVDVSADIVPLEPGPGEIGQVAAAFNRMQETAVRVAIEQAQLRRGVRDVFLSLARRSQSLLHRQLGLLDGMERRAATPDELAELFRVDHLATRMRRNAENLIVLSGAAAGRTWRKSVPMVDVMRAALAEVEDYTRVTVVPPPPAALVGPAVGDVIHLLAELVENAVSFSPPQTAVRMSGREEPSVSEAPQLARGPGRMSGDIVDAAFVIEVEDRGLGMSEEQRAAANELLRRPPEFTLTGSARLGLYVVSRLAARHGVLVELRESPYGGTTAVVTVPADLITVVAASPAHGRRDDDDELAPIGARWAAAGGSAPGERVGPGGPVTPHGREPGGPTRSGATPTTPTGLPVRQRSTPPSAAAPADEPPPRPTAIGRATPTPLPGLVLPGHDGEAPE